MRMDIASSDAKQLSAVLNRDLVRPIIDLNFGRQRRYPQLIIGTPEKEDISALVQNIGVLAPYGLTLSKKQLRSKLGLDAPEDADDVFGQVMTPASFERPPAAFNKQSSPAAADFVDEVADEALQDWEMLEEPLLNKVDGLIEKLIAEGKGLEELKKQLPEVSADPKRLAVSLANNAVYTRAAGEKDDG